MGKKGSRAGKSGGAGREKGGEAWSFLGESFPGVDRGTVKRHLLYLVLVSLATRLAVLVATPAVFHSFVDLFDLGFYLQNAGLPLLQGKIPYLNFGIDYPVLVFVPIVIALVPAILTNSGMAFIYSFQFLMVLCDLGILACVYFTGLGLRGERAAWTAGLVYATSFAAAYFVLTKYDAFPTLFFMGAVLFTVYGRGLKGYASATLGFFAKIFPAVAFPFIVLYRAKDTSLRQEIVSAAKVFLPFAVVLFLPLAIVRPDTINAYLFATGASVGVYVNTATFTLYSWLHDVARLGVSEGGVSLVMYLLMGLSILLLLWAGWREPRGRPASFLKLLAAAVFAFVFFTKFHSPQYLVWYTPLLALLVADDLKKIGVFYLTQALAYIEFPLMFNAYYVNLNYTNPAGSGGWFLTLAFFTVENLAFLLLFGLVLRPDGGFREKLAGLNPWPARKG
ncbi:MAG TPA: hypothetical protein VLV30_06415 [Methanomicrobiales archaeon]|nr:hypothetical protein [Methanomicrobiales archaeon]